MSDRFIIKLSSIINMIRFLQQIYITLVFKYNINIHKVTCSILFTVYSKDIKWVPIGHQADMFPNGAKQFGVLEQDILICKMRPGHEIHVFMHAVKGIGKDHAKFSPVGT